MALARKRMRIATAVAILGTFLAAGPASPALASADGPTINLTSLGFTADAVDSTGNAPGFPLVDLKWTIVDRDAAATSIRGTVELRLFKGHVAVGPAKTYTWVLEPDGLSDVFADDWWNSSAQQSSYTLTFLVPQYGPAEHVTWQVTSLTASDDRGHSRTFTHRALSGFDNSVAVTELVDSTNPELQTFGRASGQLSQVYSAGGPLTLKYFLMIGEQAGFWKGKVRLEGPRGARASSSFELTKANPFTWMCGDQQNSDNQWVTCGVSVTLPAGSPVGVWRVASLELTDTAGNRGTYSVDASSNVRTTRNQPLSATNFTLSATEVDNWREAQTVWVRMRPVGAQGAITAVRLATGCSTRDTIEVAPDGTVSVPIVMTTIQNGCSVDGIAIEDAAGNLALYGSHYGAPPLDLQVRRVADTTPPVVLSAELNPSTAPSSTLYAVSAHVTLEPSRAPISGYSFTFYNERGESMGGGSGGLHENPDGSVTIEAYLYFPPPGVYTGGFTLTDAAGNHALYGYPNAGSPIPTGPLVLTVTEG
jgi:hypothetical protein